jgi:hypothetical protein
MKPVFFANQAVKKIGGMMETYEIQMDKYKQEIERRLLNDVRVFQTELADV